MKNRVCVFVNTYLRPYYLEDCLRHVSALILPPDTDMWCLVVDNDKEESSKPPFEAAAKDFPFPIVYCVEPERGACRATNFGTDEMLKRGATHTLYVPDDMVVPPNYLCDLMANMDKTQCDAIRGKMIRLLDDGAQTQLRRSSVLSRRSILPGNGVLLRNKRFFGEWDLRWDERFMGGGGDGDFFYRAHLLGAKLVSLESAVFFEHRPASRLRERSLKNDIIASLGARRQRAAIRRFRGGIARGLGYVVLHGVPLLAQCIGHIFLLLFSPRKHGSKLLIKVARVGGLVRGMWGVPWETG